MQAVNYAFPLITLPYITRLFGPELYGIINFAASIITYFTLIVNYGFDLSATRDIAQSKDNWEKVQLIFNNILFSKIFLFVISSIILLIVVFSVSKIYQYKFLYLIMFLGIGCNIFFPTWFFQGIEKLTLTATLTFIIKFIFTLSVFLIIKSKDDYLMYPISTLVGQIIVALISYRIVRKNYNVKIKYPLVKEICLTLKKGAKVFYTTLVINLYTTSNIVFLGFLASDYDVGIFSAAYKVIFVVISLLCGPLSQSLFPSIGYSFTKSYEIGIKKIYKSILPVIVITIIPSIFIFLFSDFIIKILYGDKYLLSVLTLRILAFIPFIVGLSNVFFIQGLINLKKDKYALIITIIGAMSGILLNLILVPLYHFNGAALTLLLTETIITILSFIFFKKYTTFR